MDGIGTVIERAVHPTPGGGKPKRSVNNTYIRRVVVDGDFLCEGVKLPIAQICAREKSPGHGGKQPVFPLKENKTGVSRLPKRGIHPIPDRQLILIGKI
jgi:hypothetical protein